MTIIIDHFPYGADMSAHIQHMPYMGSSKVDWHIIKLYNSNNNNIYFKQSQRHDCIQTCELKYVTGTKGSYDYTFGNRKFFGSELLVCMVLSMFKSCYSFTIYGWYKIVWTNENVNERTAENCTRNNNWYENGVRNE